MVQNDLATQRIQQLEQALVSRIAIEQAKGMLAERFGIEVDEAFEHLRCHARSNNQKLADVAAGVVNRTVDVDPSRRRSVGRPSFGVVPHGAGVDVRHTGSS